MSEINTRSPSTPLLPPELKDLREGELFVNELFLSIQGESTHAGRPCFFIRLAGCPLRCRWCDTAYAFHEGSPETVARCVDRAVASGCRLVEVTGGEPLAQKQAHGLLSALCERGFEVLLETSGAYSLAEVDPRVRAIVDWKCPASGMVAHNRLSLLEELRPGDELKFVLADRSDYEYARAWLRERSGDMIQPVTVHFSPVFGRLPLEELAHWILEDGLDVRLNLQIHKIIWSPDTRGV